MATDSPNAPKSHDEGPGTPFYFISYSHQDREAIEKIRRGIQKGSQSFHLWFDEHIEPGDRFAPEIQKAIGNCNIMLFLASKNSVKSDYCLNEITFAVNMKKRIVPLRLHSETELPAAKLPLEIQGVKYIDFSVNFEGGLEKLRTRLARDQRESPLHIESVAINALLPSAKTKPVVINAPSLKAPRYFQSRDEQCRTIEEFLADDVRVLLWINGRAGSGKTTLACRALERVQLGVGDDPGQKISIDVIAYIRQEPHAWSDWYNLFSTLRRLATAKNAAEPKEPGQGRSHIFDIQNLLTNLADRRVVLFIDHFDGLIDWQTRTMRGRYLRDALQAVLTATTHRLKVIVTSQVLPRDLSMAQRARWDTLNLEGGLLQPDAMQLFRVLDQDGTLGLQRGDEAFLAELCRRTQGNPGAIERLHTMLVTGCFTTPAAILQDEKHFLPEGVLDALIGKRYVCLDEASKTMMQILSVCNHPVTADAVVWVFRLYYPEVDYPAIDPHEILKQLVNMQLVQNSDQGYFLQAADQWYVKSQLSDNAPSTVGGSQDVHLDRKTLYKQHADCIERPISTNDPTVGGGWHTSQFEQVHYYRFNETNYAAAFDVLKQLEPQLSAEGRSGELAGYYEQLVGKLEDPTQSRQLFDALARIYYGRGELDRAVVCYEGGLKCVREKGDLNGQLLYLGNLALCKQESGDLVRTTLYCMAALELANQMGDSVREAYVWEAHIWNVISEVLASLGQISAAVQASKRALKLARDNRRREIEGMGIVEVVALANLGQHHEAQGSVDRADAQCSRAYEFAEKIQFQLGQATARRNLGMLELNQRKCKQASRHLTEAMQLAKNAQNVQLQQTIRIELAAAQLQDSKLSDAEVTVNTAVAFDTPFFTPEAFSLRGIIFQRQGKAPEAAESFHHALKQAELVLRRTPRYYRGLDVMGLSYVGLTLSEETDEYLDKAVGAYEAARFITDEPGIVRRRLLLFDALAKDDSEKKLALVRNAITPAP
jgi:tetratricopeptide (TPR) repeat protein